MPFLSRALHRFLAGASLTLLAAALLSPGRANAECGDYVMVGGKHAAPVPHAPSTSSHEPAVPCHGPNCSKRPNLPIVPPAPPPSVSAAEWACLAAGLSLPPAPDSGSYRDESSADPIHRTGS